MPNTANIQKVIELIKTHSASFKMSGWGSQIYREEPCGCVGAFTEFTMRQAPEMKYATLYDSDYSEFLMGKGNYASDLFYPFEYDTYTSDDAIAMLENLASTGEINWVHLDQGQFGVGA